MNVFNSINNWAIFCLVFPLFIFLFVFPVSPNSKCNYQSSYKESARKSSCHSCGRKSYHDSSNEVKWLIDQNQQQLLLHQNQ